MLEAGKSEVKSRQMKCLVRVPFVIIDGDSSLCSQGPFVIVDDASLLCSPLVEGGKS